MNTCGTCKYFGAPAGEAEEEDEFSDVPPGYHICQLIEHTAGLRELARGPACLIDGSGYFAALCVREDFGCNQWEGKA